MESLFKKFEQTVMSNTQARVVLQLFVCHSSNAGMGAASNKIMGSSILYGNTLFFVSCLTPDAT